VIRAARRVLIIGLDCAAPKFAFDTAALPLPNVHRLMREGLWGELRSCDPPITVPAWSCMTTGRDAGALGVYGFRNRRDYSYGPLALASSLDIREKRLWDYAGDAGLDSIVLGVPQTYPPQPLRGCLVTDLLTPSTSVAYTYPESLAPELREAAGEYIIDVPDFRADQRDGLAERIHALMHNRFDYAEYLVRAKPWDLFMMVEIGLDRIHHAFWQDADPEHPDYQAGNPYEQVIPDYYRALDVRIGRLLDMVGPETVVLVVSDHGARAMQGGFAVNQWLIEHGYLTLKAVPTSPVPLTPDMVDWPRTQSWGEGGYYARICLNVAGREPQGIVPRADYERLRSELIVQLEAVAGPTGKPLGNWVLKPEAIYDTVSGVAPDLLAYFGGLAWRSVGKVGGDLFWRGNDAGPDGANHDFSGILILRGPGITPRRDGRYSIFEVAPTVLQLLGLPIPSAISASPLQLD
jgi:predicted AlkP superfamily phosphohydrolase/phosphomutase